MTSKERVKLALAHKQADRVPVDYEANPEIDERLKSRLGLAADDQEGLLAALGVDIRGVYAPYAGPKLHADVPGRVVDEWGRRARWITHETGGYWDWCDWPLSQATPEEVEAWPMPSADHYDYSTIARQCRQWPDRFILAGSPGIGDIINATAMLRTMEQVLVDLITDDPAGLLLIDRRLQVHLEMMRRTLQAGEGMIDMLLIGEDLGTQRGPTMSLELFRRHLRPRMQKFVDLGRQFGIPVMIHSCGSSSWAFDDFLEMGITVVDTLQPEALNMAPAYLKQRWGESLSFHGMISTAGPVACGSVADVIDNVRQTLQVMKPGGGYILAPTHMLQSNSPVENVLAMYQAAREYGRY